MYKHEKTQSDNKPKSVIFDKYDAKRGILYINQHWRLSQRSVGPISAQITQGFWGQVIQTERTVQGGGVQNFGQFLENICLANTHSVTNRYSHCLYSEICMSNHIHSHPKYLAFTNSHIGLDHESVRENFLTLYLCSQKGLYVMKTSELTHSGCIRRVFWQHRREIVIPQHSPKRTNGLVNVVSNRARVVSLKRSPPLISTSTEIIPAYANPST